MRKKGFISAIRFIVFFLLLFHILSVVVVVIEKSPFKKMCEKQPFFPHPVFTIGLMGENDKHILIARNFLFIYLQSLNQNKLNPIEWWVKKFHFFDIFFWSLLNDYHSTTTKKNRKTISNRTGSNIFQILVFVHSFFYSVTKKKKVSRKINLNTHTHTKKNGIHVSVV